MNGKIYPSKDCPDCKVHQTVDIDARCYYEYTQLCCKHEDARVLADIEALEVGRLLLKLWNEPGGVTLKRGKKGEYPTIARIAYMKEPYIKTAIEGTLIEALRKVTG